MTYSCAYCGATATETAGCASCHRPPDPDAIEVARRDAEITTLIGNLATARRAVQDLDERIGHAWERRNAAEARVRAAARPRSARPRSRVLSYPLGVVVRLVIVPVTSTASSIARAARGE